MTDEDEVGGLADVARWLGVSVAAVKMWRYRHQRPPSGPWPNFRGLEEPDSPKGRPRYRRSKVEAWGRRRGMRLPDDQTKEAG